MDTHNSRRGFLKGAVAAPLMLTPRKSFADSPLIGPNCPIDAQVLYRMQGNAMTQAGLAASGQFDRDLAMAFLDDAIPAISGVSGDVLNMVCSAGPFLRDPADLIMTPEKSALAAQAYAMWGLTAPDGFLIHQDLQQVDIVSVQAALQAPYQTGMQNFVWQYTSAFREALIGFPLSNGGIPGGIPPLIQPNFLPEEPYPDLPTVPTRPSDPIPDWPSDPPAMPTGPYTTADAVQLWQAVASNGKILAGVGLGLCGLGYAAGYVAVIGTGVASFTLGFGLALTLLGAYAIGRATYNLIYIGSHNQMKLAY